MFNTSRAFIPFILLQANLCEVGGNKGRVVQMVLMEEREKGWTRDREV